MQQGCIAHRTLLCQPPCIIPLQGGCTQTVQAEPLKQAKVQKVQGKHEDQAQGGSSLLLALAAWVCLAPFGGRFPFLSCMGSPCVLGAGTHCPHMLIMISSVVLEMVPTCAPATGCENREVATLDPILNHAPRLLFQYEVYGLVWPVMSWSCS